jgi:hypothetical protein
MCFIKIYGNYIYFEPIHLYNWKQYLYLFESHLDLDL